MQLFSVPFTMSKDSWKINIVFPSYNILLSSFFIFSPVSRPSSLYPFITNSKTEPRRMKNYVIDFYCFFNSKLLFCVSSKCTMHHKQHLLLSSFEQIWRHVHFIIFTCFHYLISYCTR